MGIGRSPGLGWYCARGSEIACNSPILNPQASWIDPRGTLVAVRVGDSAVIREAIRWQIAAPCIVVWSESCENILWRRFEDESLMIRRLESSIMGHSLRLARNLNSADSPLQNQP